ncbi:subunit 5 of COP signalosome [Chloropicon primus]|uniref:Subunit 5 of COP signalosome n=1 Tax=Chloropicon primus TaxID=1764295 RepID=A0A5B8N0Z3_9CHLO|nr:subunit 5 of COP signalosome [Chloropicon primus]UPR04687.1 subunit 5 of COP signalosome [Chloropicon primus]|mmetsp:Transcript_2980/g.8068  ORF Transcript_2980/g.8068 Transcript_2980/m.8068 type:complete len:390 (-) Transcript_2980:234-1403(-)|eukprot:QDZ25490.1 subunit 5 of COP signalosome [Chloropicon primus]
MASESGARQAQKRWELENEVTMCVDDNEEGLTSHLNKQERKMGAEAVGGSSSRDPGTSQVQANVGRDEFWKYDNEAQQAVAQQAPWTKDPHYFKTAYVSALALLKMAIHTKQGGNIEVMGMLQGKPVGDAIVVVDAFVLPVEGTETRVNAQAEAYEYMVEYNQRSKESGRQENVVGWYHSHPGYGCWLSGIDVNTQMLNQEYTEPFLAIVIDPIRTQAAGKVEIGAFRTYPKDYKAAEEGPNEYQTIPLNKVEDFGVHCKKYYSLDIQYFKSSLDSHLFELLWNKYWVSTLSSSKVVSGSDYLSGQVKDLVEKLEQVESNIAHAGRIGGLFLVSGDKKKQNLGRLSKIAQDGCKVATEQVHSMLSQILKDRLFNNNKKNKNEASDVMEA